MMTKKLMLLTSAVLLGLTTACTWVKLTPAGENVAILTAAQVSNCREIGTTTVEVLDRAVLTRSPEKVRQELRTLARNRAAARGDTLVPVGPPVDGEQTFTVYQCRT